MMLVRVCELGVLVFLLTLSGWADADTGNEAIRLTNDRTMLLHLPRPAGNVIVNNPDHAEVTIDSPRLLVITPHQPGTTSMIVLDAAGKTMMERDIIVTNVQPKYVRIRRMCTGNDSGCAATASYYCPDGCYEVTAVAGGGGANAAGSGSSSASAGKAPPATIDGEPPQTLLGPMDNCPEGFDKVPVSGNPSSEGWTCSQK